MQLAAACLLCCNIVAANAQEPPAQALPAQEPPAQASTQPPLSPQPQAGPRTSFATHATLFGIGATRQLDTYLSPVNYRGPQLTFIKEKLRPTRLMHGRVSYQGIFQTDFTLMHNPSDNGRCLGGNMRYDATWHYSWTPLPALRVMAGPQLTAAGGFLYNTRNSNNPAQALLAADIAASAAAIYTFRLWGHTMRLREQLDVPLIGVMFSPNYTQSYYDIFSQGNYDHNVCFTHPVNRPNLRSMLTLDFPLLGATIRAGYLLDIRQSHVNNLRHHAYNHAFVIGWVKHLGHRKHRDAAQEPFIM